jgi:nucleoid-associated protein YgaU
MGLRDKYSYAIQTAKSFRMEGSADERDGKLYFHGTVGSQSEVNKIWDAIKTVPEWQNEIVADITTAGTGVSAAPDITAHTYVVRGGDTLSKIAKELLGDSGAFMDIFNANRDQLSDPNAIRPGQVLKIPVPAKR